MGQKHAYLIMAHNKFGQLGRLLKALDNEDNTLFVHIDKKCKAFDLDILNELKAQVVKSNIYIYNEISVYWSHFSQVQCELFLLRKAVNKGEFAYYHLLSGMDFPIKSQEYIHEFFEENAGKEFVDYQRAFFEHHKDIILDRVRYYHPFRKYCRFFNNNIFNDFFRVLDKLSVILQKIAGVNLVKKNQLDICYGANWFSITGAFAKYILENETFIYQNFRFCNCPDEIFVQTLLKASSFRGNLYKETTDNFYGNMRLVDFHRGNPYTYHSSDIEEIKKSEYLFVRKIDEDVDRHIEELILDIIK